MPPRFSLDLLDYRVIQELHRDARISATDIARKTGANERTIRKRIDRLVDLGVIRLTAIVNPQAFNYVVTIDVFLEADPEFEHDIIYRLLRMPEITYMAYGQGTRDISIEARFRDNGDMHEFLRRRLPAIPGLEVKGYTLVPKILRNIDEWMPALEDLGLTADLANDDEADDPISPSGEPQ